MYRYEFTSTVDDLLEAEEAERSRLMRGPFRWLAVALGVAWFAAGLVALVKQPTWQAFIWVCLGTGVLYYFVIGPRERRTRIKSNNVERQELTLEFAHDRMTLGVSGHGQFTRQWNELAGIADTDKGILFYFTDGVKNWLPNRVFTSEAERGSFLEFLKGRTARDAQAG
jgi:hypothetical protein